ncbi:hypothetical protein PHYSODRAFT_369061, partial [Phytophthora sojae]
PKKKQKSYTVREKREALQLARGTVHGWWKQAEKLFSFTGHSTSKSRKGQGRREVFPDILAVVTFMKDVRREEKVSLHGFTSQKPQTAKNSTEELEQTRAEFALDFWKTHAAYGPEGMYNVDETAINFDMPPARMWAGRGRRDAARIANTSKHTGRMTAVLTIRADGKKLPILFVLRDKLGGRIDTSKFEEYPEGHFYTV